MKKLKESLKRVLPRSTIDSLKKSQHQLSIQLVRALASSALLRRVYFAFFSDAFDREARAVVVGHLRHVENQGGAEATNYFLRRAIHRLEKGLIMQPRKPVFALDYIDDAVTAYECSLIGPVSADEVCWAHDVLAAYFKVTASHPIIDAARQRFERAGPPPVRCANLRQADAELVPFAAGEAEPAVTYTDFHLLAMQRRSVRWYQPRPVPRELIDNAVLSAVQSPSACNRQPYRFMIFDDPAAVARVSELPMGVAGFNHNFPAIVAVVGQLRAYPHVRDRHVIYIDGALAAMAFMFALQSQGISSCSINWPDIPEREAAAAKELNLAADERIVMFISLGYATGDGMIPFSQKLPLEDARSYGLHAAERV